MIGSDSSCQISENGLVRTLPKVRNIENWSAWTLPRKSMLPIPTPLEYWAPPFQAIMSSTCWARGSPSASMRR